MNRHRTAAISLAALLSVGGTTALGAAVASAEDTTTTTTVTPAPPTDLSVSLPGLGDVSLSVDPSTGAILSVTVIPLDGVAAGTPVVVENGVVLDFTLADGTTRTIFVEVEREHGVVTAKVESPHSDDSTDDPEDDDHTGPPPIDQRGVSIDHRNDDNEHSQGEHRGTSTTSTTTSSGTSRTDDDHEDDHEDDDGGRRTTPTTTVGSSSARGERD